jgi:hypothetical protein
MHTYLNVWQLPLHTLQISLIPIPTMCLWCSQMFLWEIWQWSPSPRRSPAFPITRGTTIRLRWVYSLPQAHGLPQHPIVYSKYLETIYTRRWITPVSRSWGGFCPGWSWRPLVTASLMRDECWLEHAGEGPIKYSSVSLVLKPPWVALPLHVILA